MGRTTVNIINNRSTSMGNLPIAVANKRRVTLKGYYWVRPAYSKMFIKIVR